MILLLAGCGSGDEIDNAESCIGLVRAYNGLAAETAGTDAIGLRDRAEARLDELIDRALDEGRDADALVCETGRSQMAIPSVFEGIGDSLDDG